MEVYFNELSAIPLVEADVDAKNKVLVLLETLKELRQTGFNVMRASKSFYDLALSPTYTIQSFLSDSSVSATLKTLLTGVVRRPYISDESSYEAEIFILSQFKVKDEAGEDLLPEGLAIAYIYTSPVVSLSGNAYWHREWIPLEIETEDQDTIIENILNVHSSECVVADYFTTWLSDLNDNTVLNTIQNIQKVFPPDRFSFDQRAYDDIIFWYYNDKRFLVRIKELIDDIAANPFNGGKGHTEVLKGEGGKASKRIVKKDRIIYTYTRERITIHQCRFHY